MHVASKSIERYKKILLKHDEEQFKEYTAGCKACKVKVVDVAGVLKKGKPT